MNPATRVKRVIKSGSALLGFEVKRYNPIDKFVPRFNRRNVKTFLYLSRMLEIATRGDGVVVECGVGKARTFQMLALLLEEEDKGRPLWGFDSFEGFPEPSKEDASPRNPKKGEWKVMRHQDAEALIADLRVDTPVKIVKGFFEDTLARTTELPPIALLHLDVDLYQSYKTCLENLFPKVIKGGVVMFDEYRNPGERGNFPGARTAIDEYFARTPYKVRQDSFCGKYFLVKDR
jgi:hypothetical protein